VPMDNPKRTLLEITPKRTLQVYSGRSNLPLAEQVARHLDVELGEPNLVDFPSGELRCRLGQNVRGSDIFIVQTHAHTMVQSVNDAIMEQLIMIDAAKRASAKRITAVMPYYGYARQDRKSQGREPITAKLVADMFTAAGADRLMSVDLHSSQIQGFFDGPVDHLTAMYVLLDHLKETAHGEYVIVAPDTGRTKVAEQAAKRVGVDMAAVYKRRDKAAIGSVEARGVMGEEAVAGKLCVLIDDMIDTAATICAAADVLVAAGATEVWAMCTHGVLSGPAVDRLNSSKISRLITTDTLPIPVEKQMHMLEVVSIAPLLAAAIDAVFEDRSVSEIFGGLNQS
jgi:ribose-phosphate pyrophosphokinase